MQLLYFHYKLMSRVLLSNSIVLFVAAVVLNERAPYKLRKV